VVRVLFLTSSLPDIIVFLYTKFKWKMPFLTNVPFYLIYIIFFDKVKLRVHMSNFRVNCMLRRLRNAINFTHILPLIANFC